ncbi:YtxH domain-containing protein [Bhargavaea ullalensis]|uniref:Gas vesicle protein n=1 Tax=Bhargavaea ullalensis TaxID=1265685 RepID=A0ABV2GDA0_9BACL
MAGSKFGKMVAIGALAGAVISMFDRNTRNSMMSSAKKLGADVRYYAKNPDILQWKVRDQVDKYKALADQFSSDKQYLTDKAAELKELTPTVKGLVEDTKEAFTDSKDMIMQAKDEYKDIASKPLEGTDKTFVPEKAYEDGSVDGEAAKN